MEVGSRRIDDRRNSARDEIINGSKDASTWGSLLVLGNRAIADLGGDNITTSQRCIDHVAKLVLDARHEGDASNEGLKVPVESGETFFVATSSMRDISSVAPGTTPTIIVANCPVTPLVVRDGSEERAKVGEIVEKSVHVVARCCSRRLAREEKVDLLDFQLGVWMKLSFGSTSMPRSSMPSQSTS